VYSTFWSQIIGIPSAAKHDTVRRDLRVFALVRLCRLRGRLAFDVTLARLASTLSIHKPHGMEKNSDLRYCGNNPTLNALQISSQGSFRIQDKFGVFTASFRVKEKRPESARAV